MLAQYPNRGSGGSLLSRLVDNDDDDDDDDDDEDEDEDEDDDDDDDDDEDEDEDEDDDNDDDDDDDAINNDDHHVSNYHGLIMRNRVYQTR